MKKAVYPNNNTWRIVRNILFWILFTFYHYEGKGSFTIHYPALFLTLVLSYGAPCYVNNLLLIPSYLLRHRYLSYMGLFLLLLAITTVGSYYSTHWLNNMFPTINYMGNLKNVAMPYHVFPSMLLFTLLAFGKFTADAITNQRRLDDLEKQTLESELEQLRAQINPHFLFNALNTIYGMARRTDKETADAIMKLSDILRHGLYECTDDRIPVQKELQLLQQYIDFARLRLYDKSKITMEVDAGNEQGHMAPLLLMPFVENAIKHGLGRHANNGRVQIAISVRKKELKFICINSNYNKRQAPNTLSEYGGIGFKNVKRRLELLYPERHTLHITDGADEYRVELNLQLS